MYFVNIYYDSNIIENIDHSLYELESITKAEWQHKQQSYTGNN